MSKKKEQAEDKDLEFAVMPGADAPEEDDAPLDLSFEEPEAEPETEEAEETVAETEEAEEVEAEEPVAETEEPEAEAEEPEEQETETPVAEAEAEEKKAPMVPKSRLDEVLNKQKALQKQLDDINAAKEQADTAPETYDFDAKELEYQNFVLDGETEKAVALRREIRNAERNGLEFEMRREMNQTVAQDRQMTALQQAATAMEEAYPVFDRNHRDFNEDYTTEVVELRDAFIAKGDDAVDALSKAVKYVVKDRELDGQADPVPSLAATPKSDDEVAKKRAQVSKKLKAAESQPPELPGESSSSHGEKGQDISAMTEEEFDALPAATLKRLRGDII